MENGMLWDRTYNKELADVLIRKNRAGVVGYFTGLEPPCVLEWFEMRGLIPDEERKNVTRLISLGQSASREIRDDPLSGSLSWYLREGVLDDINRVEEFRLRLPLIDQTNYRNTMASPRPVHMTSPDQLRLPIIDRTDHRNSPYQQTEYEPEPPSYETIMYPPKTPSRTRSRYTDNSQQDPHPPPPYGSMDTSRSHAGQSMRQDTVHIPNPPLGPRPDATSWNKFRKWKDNLRGNRK